MLVAATVAEWLLRASLPVTVEAFGRQAPSPDAGSATFLLGPSLALGLGVAAWLALVLSGLVPMLQLVRSRLSPLLAGNASGTDSVGRSRVRSIIVAAQVAATFTLLAGAALMLQSAWHLGRVDVGFDPTRVVSANLTLHERSYHTVADRRRLVDGVVRRIEALPGVEAAGLIGGWPTGVYPGEPVAAAPATPDKDSPVAVRRSVNASYFKALGLHLVAGRALTESDATAPAPVAVIGETLARLIWPNGSAVGRQLVVGSASGDGMHATAPQTLTVVGVTRPVLRSLTEPSPPEIYVSLERSPGSFLFLQVRATGREALALVPSIERAVLAEDPNLPLAEVGELEDLVMREGVRPRALAGVLLAFGLLTGGIAMIGVYAVSAWMARQRQREAAVRLALGATSASVVRLIVGRGAVMVLAGLIAGWMASAAAGRLVASELHGVSAGDPLTRLSVGLVVGVVCLTAIFVPARRAASADPAAVLKAI